MKIYKIKCCSECPKYGVIYHIHSSQNWCYMENKYVDNIEKLPYWCPLPDYKEEDNERNTNTKSN